MAVEDHQFGAHLPVAPADKKADRVQVNLFDAEAIVKAVRPFGDLIDSGMNQCSSLLRADSMLNSDALPCKKRWRWASTPWRPPKWPLNARRERG